MYHLSVVQFENCVYIICYDVESQYFLEKCGINYNWVDLKEQDKMKGHLIHCLALLKLNCSP